MKSEITNCLAPETLSARMAKKSISTKIAKKLFEQIRSIFLRSVFTEIICALLIILFIYTGMNKLMDLEKFKAEMQRSPFIEHWAGIISYAVPIGELIIAACLVIQRTRLFALYISLSIMTLFTGYIWLMLRYAYDLPCSCGGIISKLSWHDHLIFNLSFTILTVVAIAFSQKRNFQFESLKETK